SLCASTALHTLSLHDALPIFAILRVCACPLTVADGGQESGATAGVDGATGADRVSLARAGGSCTALRVRALRLARPLARCPDARGFAVGRGGRLCGRSH